MALNTQLIEGLDTLDDRRVREEVVKMCRTIQDEYPEAEFQVSPNPTYRGAIIQVQVDSNEIDTLVEIVADHVIDLLVQEDISIRVHLANPRYAS